MKRIVVTAAWAGALMLSACSSEQTNENEADNNPDQQQKETTGKEETSTTNERTEEDQQSSDSDEEANQEESSSEAQENHSPSSTEDETEAEGENESADRQEAEEPISEDEVSDRIFSYIQEQEGFEAEEVQVRIENREGEAYRAQVFQSVPDDAEQQATQTLRWYTVDRQSGEVQDAAPGTETEEEAPEPMISGIVSMSDGERNAHHRRLAAEEEHLQDQVLDQLLLPGIHENTISYGGRIGEDESIQWEFPDDESRAEGDMVSADVNEEGYFQIDLAPYEFSEGDTITVRITGGYPQEQVFELPVYEAEERTASIQVR